MKNQSQILEDKTLGDNLKRLKENIIEKLRERYLDLVLNHGLDLEDIIEDLVNCLTIKELKDRIKTFNEEE